MGLPVKLESEVHLGAVGGHIVTPSDFLIRPADTDVYGATDLVANSTTAANVKPLIFRGCARIPGGSCIVRRARLVKSDDDLTAAIFRLHLFTAFLTTAVGDNGDLTGALTGDLAAYIDYINLDMTVAANIHTNDNVAFGVPVTGSEISVVMPNSETDLIGLLECRGAHTAASAERFTVTLEVWQD